MLCFELCRSTSRSQASHTFFNSFPRPSPQVMTQTFSSQDNIKELEELEEGLSAQDIILFRRTARSQMPRTTRFRYWLKTITQWATGIDLHQDQVSPRWLS
jgi:hypothetical protein